MKTTFLDSIQDFENILKHFKEHAYPVLESITLSILNCYRQGGKVLLIGNGGSAADCQHLAGELMGRFFLNRIPLPAISLTADTALISCIANDYDFESIFSRQIQGIGVQNDVLLAFSTSGSSKNIIKAVQTAKDLNVKVISFTGRTNTLLEQMSDICLCAHTDKTDHAQEIHQMAYHIICKYIDQEYETKTTLFS